MIDNQKESKMGDIDRNCIEKMIAHHKIANVMADIALKEAEHSEIKQIASEIKRDEIEDMLKMREIFKSYGMDISLPKLDEARKILQSQDLLQDPADIARLKHAKPFDKAFLEEMVPHHQMAIKMSKNILNNSSNQDLRLIAESIIKKENHEIDQMKDWYQEWYGQPLVENNK